MQARYVNKWTVGDRSNNYRASWKHGYRASWKHGDYTIFIDVTRWDGYPRWSIGCVADSANQAFTNLPRTGELISHLPLNWEWA